MFFINFGDIVKRDDKKAHLSRLSDVLSSGAFLVGVNFFKLSAADCFALRKSVNQVGGFVVVVKNKVAKIAISESSISEASSVIEKIVNPVVFVYGTDVVSLAKVVGEFCKSHKVSTSVIFGFLDGKVISANEVVQLSEIPSLEELRSRLLYLISYAVPLRLMRVLSAPSVGLVRILDHISRPSI